MLCECGQYGLLITMLPDGTHIHDCLSCGRLWAERLVTFEVTFRLVEVMGNGHDGNGCAPESVLAVASSS